MVSHPWSLGGATVLLTGAAGALGRSAARAFTAAGARVVGVDRNAAPLAALAGEGALAGHLVADLTDPAVPERITAGWPRIDILVNNVGAGTAVPLADTTDDVLDAMLDINLRAAGRLCRAIVPGMAARGRGKVINVSSVLAFHPVPIVAAYAAAKAALVAFTRAVALEYAARGVQVNALCPGYLDGPKNAGYFASAAGRAFVDSFMPTGAVGRADALDGPLLFLASSMSDHVTGHALVVDGGYSIW